MPMPFQKLMEYAADLREEEWDKTMGELAGRIGETSQRLADAATAVRVLAGERTYVSAAEVRGRTDPVVRQALEKDRGGIASGFSG
jgi:hypothetical protein